jgi:hypothetical protein
MSVVSYTGRVFTGLVDGKNKTQSLEKITAFDGAEGSPTFIAAYKNASNFSVRNLGATESSTVTHKGSPTKRHAALGRHVIFASSDPSGKSDAIFVYSVVDKTTSPVANFSGVCSVISAASSFVILLAAQNVFVLPATGTFQHSMPFSSVLAMYEPIPASLLYQYFWPWQVRTGVFPVAANMSQLFSFSSPI